MNVGDRVSHQFTPQKLLGTIDIVLPSRHHAVVKWDDGTTSIEAFAHLRKEEE